MLIDFSSIVQQYKNIPIRGILHVGAHQCEEDISYRNCNVNDILWIEAIPSLYENMKSKGHNIYNYVVSDVVENITLNIANNGQSSSILELGTHAQYYPHIKYVGEYSTTTNTIANIYNELNIDPYKYNFWNLDIQGVELKALKGAGDILKHVDFIYTEVNVEHVYKDCSTIDELDNYLSGYGFNRVSTVMTDYGWGDALYIKM